MSPTDTDQPSQALTVRRAASLTAYEPADLQQGYQLAQYLAKSGMLGKDIKSAEQALTVMVAGRELGFTAMQSLRAIYIVEGRVTLSADAMVALVLRSPECESLTLVESTAEVCTYKTKRRGQSEVTMTVTAADAKTAGWGATHAKYPAIMKRHRCASNICRAVYPDVVLGMMTPDEAEEMAPLPSPVQPLPQQQTQQRQEQPAVDRSQAVDAEWSHDEPAIDPAQAAMISFAAATDMPALTSAFEAAKGTFGDKPPVEVRDAFKSAKARIAKAATDAVLAAGREPGQEG